MFTDKFSVSDNVQYANLDKNWSQRCEVKQYHMVTFCHGCICLRWVGEGGNLAVWNGSPPTKPRKELMESTEGYILPGT